MGEKPNAFVISSKNNFRRILTLYKQNPTLNTRKAFNYSVTVLCKHWHMFDPRSHVFWSNPHVAFCVQMLQEGSVSEMGAAAALQHGAEAVCRHHRHPREHVRDLGLHSGDDTSFTASDRAVPFIVEFIFQSLKQGIKHHGACRYKLCDAAMKL